MRRFLALVLVALLVGAPVALAKWQSVLQVSVGSAPLTPTLTFIAQNAGTQSTNTQTWTGVSIGAAFSTRRVIVASGNAATNSPLTSPTICGISATIHEQSVSGNAVAALYSADVPTGTTCTIVETWANGTFNSATNCVYTTDDSQLNSTTPVVNSAGSTTSPIAVSLTSISGGFVIGAIGAQISLSGTYTPPAGYTLDSSGANTSIQACWHLIPTASGTNSLSTSYSNTLSNLTVSAGAWD